MYETRMLRIPFIHYVSNAIDAYSFIKMLKPDIIHAQHGGPGLLLKKIDVPQILTIHSLSQLFKDQYAFNNLYGAFMRSGSLILKAFERWNFLHTDRFVSVYSQCKSDLYTHYHISPNKVELIPNGVDPNLYHPNNQKPSIIDEYGKVFLFSGTNDERKGLPELMRIINQFNKRYQRDDVSFIITGTGPLHNTLKQFAQRFNNVHCLGFVPDTYLKALYASSYAFLFPTRIEAFPFSLLEALSSGLPIITTPVGGIPDLFKYGLDIGMMLHVNGNINKIVDYMVFLLENESDLRRIKTNSRLLIEQNYSWDKISHSIIDLYKRVIDNQ
jgi:glycosyltransferase involved in cell wall biosynthesis